MPSFRRCSRRSPSLARAPRRRSVRAARAGAAARRRRAALAASARADRAPARAARSALRQTTTRATAASAARRSSRPHRRSSPAPARGERDDVAGARCGRWPRGGIYDQVGGGFSRYAVDATWTVPHFEKMLYDNALLARAYLHGWQVAGDAPARRRPRDARLGLREMRGPEGGFYSSLDADSEGVEGRFYVWTLAELHEALGDARPPRSPTSARAQRATSKSAGERAAERVDRAAAAAARAHPRAPARGARGCACGPALDDKRLTAWNALMISALADAGRAAPRDAGRDRAAAARDAARASCCASCATRGAAAAQLQPGLAPASAPTWRITPSCWRRCSSLYEATFEERWFVAARALADTILGALRRPERGGFFSTADDGEALSRGARTSRTRRSRPDPRAQRSACCASRAHRRAPTSGRRSACWRWSPRSPRATPARSATCCGAALVPLPRPADRLPGDRAARPPACRRRPYRIDR